MSEELNKMFEQFILEWIQLNYHDAKIIQQERHKDCHTERNKELNDRELIHILFLSYHTNIIKYILKQKKLKYYHKIPMIEYIVQYHQIIYNIQNLDDILEWKNVDKPSYLIQHLICIYIKTDKILKMMLQVFEDFENEVVVLK